MTTPVLICDDSLFARRAMERSIPDAWDVEISFAENGKEALTLVRAGKADVMFLDLNMPVMDGYQTMQAIRNEDLPTMVIVVSGDVQPEARKRMIALGAVDFIQKPIDNLKLSQILQQYGLYSGDTSSNKRVENLASPLLDRESEQLDAYREMANIAMGRAGEQLAKLLGEFINLPIPNVNLITYNELHMAITEIKQNDSVSAVSKGFISSGINGEALMIFNDSNFTNMSKLLKYNQKFNSETLELEALMDISNIVIGTCLNALSEQLHVTFSHNHPIILGRHCDLNDILLRNESRREQILAIEIAYSIKSQNINFDLLLMFPGEAIERVYAKLVKSAI